LIQLNVVEGNPEKMYKVVYDIRNVLESEELFCACDEMS
jgi:hypothetical protein